MDQSHPIHSLISKEQTIALEEDLQLMLHLEEMVEVEEILAQVIETMEETISAGMIEIVAEAAGMEV